MLEVKSIFFFLNFLFVRHSTNPYCSKVCGILMAKVAESVVLTDHNNAVIDLLQYNIQLNESVASKCPKLHLFFFPLLLNSTFEKKTAPQKSWNGNQKLIDSN